MKGILLAACLALPGAAALAETPKEGCVSFNPDRVEAGRLWGEWKVVDGNHVMLGFGEDEAAARKAVAVIQHYRLTQSCAIGHRHPRLEFFKTATGVPEGAFPGEDCRSYSGGSGVIQKYGFRYQCFVGDPGYRGAMRYFRK